MTKKQRANLAKRIGDDLAAFVKTCESVRNTAVEVLGSPGNARQFEARLRFVRVEFVNCLDELIEYVENA